MVAVVQVVWTRVRAILAVPSSPAIRSRWSELFRGATDVPRPDIRASTLAWRISSSSLKASPERPALINPILSLIESVSCYCCGFHGPSKLTERNIIAILESFEMLGL